MHAIQLTMIRPGPHGCPNDAEVRDDISMREAGHADRGVHARYNHILIEAHLAAAEQVAALVRKAGGGS